MAPIDIKHIDKLTGIKNGVANLNTILNHLPLSKELLDPFYSGFPNMDKMIDIIRKYPDDIRILAGINLEFSMDSLQSILSLPNMSKLDSIVFIKCKLTTNNSNFEWDVASLKNLQNLHTFMLNGDKSVIDASHLSKLLSSCESLKTLDLYNNNFNSQELAQIINTLGDHCPKLTSLAIDGNKVLEDEVLDSLIEARPNLPDLTIISLPYVTLDTLATVTEVFGNKVKVRVENIIPRPGEEEIQNEEIINFAQYCKANNYDVYWNLRDDRTQKDDYNADIKKLSEEITNKPLVGSTFNINETDVDLNKLYEEHQKDSSKDKFVDWAAQKISSDFGNVFYIKGNNVSLTTKELQILLSCPNMNHLRVLEVDNSTLFTENTNFGEALGKLPNVANLSDFMLTNNPQVNVLELNKILSSCGQLSLVWLSNNKLVDTDLASVINSINSKKLFWLDIRGNDLGIEGAEALVANSNILHVKHLALPEVTLEVLRTITETFGSKTEISVDNIIPPSDMSEGDITGFVEDIIEFAAQCYDNGYKLKCGMGNTSTPYSQLFNLHIKNLQKVEEIFKNSEDDEESMDLSEEMDELIDEVIQILGKPPADITRESGEVLMDGADNNREDSEFVNN